MRSTSTSTSSPHASGSEAMVSRPATPSRSRLPSSASTLSSDHSTFGVVRPSTASALAPVVAPSNGTRLSTSPNVISARLGQNDRSKPISATVAPGSDSSHDILRRVHHAASFSDIGDGQRVQAANTLQPTKSNTPSLLKPTSSHSPSSMRLPRPHTGWESGSISDPSTRTRLRLSPGNVNGRGPTVTSPSRNGHHSDGGASSDRAPSAAAHLDVKRLLSKPAAPSRASLYSATSDSDTPAAEILRSQSPTSHSSHTVITTAPWLGFSRAGLLTPTTDRYASSGAVSPSRSLSAGRSSRRADVSPIRSVALPSPASREPMIAGVAAIRSNADKERERPRLLRKRSRGKGDAHPSASSPISSSSPSARRPVTADGRLNSYAISSPKLTPAGAIAQAYKEQDVRRKRLAAAARGELLSSDSVDRALKHPPTNMAESARPYGSFGSPTGSADDKEDGSNACASPRPSPNVAASSPSASARHSLVRKVSGRFSRHKQTSSFVPGLNELPVIPSVKSRSSSSQQSDPRKSISEPRKSLQERRSTSLPKERRKGLRLSLDGGIDRTDDFAMPKRSEEIRTATGAGSDASPNSATGTGGKLWRLVKRLSSNSLHSKYQGRGNETMVPATPPPPVPAIPKDLLQMPTRFNLSLSGDTSTPYRSASPSSQASPVATEGRGRRPSAATGASKPSPVSVRRSTVTRSSSPSSLFRPPSPSSASSATEDVPPTLMPGKGAPSHSRLGDKQAVHIPPSPDMPVFSIAESVNNFERRPSLSQPLSTFADATEGATMNPSLGLVSPPPRPARSPRRPSTAGANPNVFSGSSSTATSTTSPSPAVQVHSTVPAPGRSTSFTTTRTTSPALAQATRRASHDVPSSPRRVEPLNWDNLSTTSTARPRTSNTRSPPSMRMTYREMNASPPAARTAQEKDQMWDDLLERSALAGGTLHLGGAGLLSDSIRFSTVSTTSSVST